MKLLIHACCADCLLRMVESINRANHDSPLQDDITVYYYNPNIHPRSEFQSRLKAMQLMIGDLKMVVADWRPSEWFDGLILSPDKPESLLNKERSLKKEIRCPKCWRLRLERTAKYAKENGFDGFSSTLLTSEYQNTKMIEKIGQEMAKKYKIKFVIPKNICKHLETKGFYKQIFCGCCYSLIERYEEKFNKK